jgi:formylglycine-generating enzyme required for sulfatase activity
MLNFILGLGTFFNGVVNHFNGQKSRDHSREIEEERNQRTENAARLNRESSENIAREHREHDWRKHEEMKALQREGVSRNCEALFKSAEIHREATLRLPEEQGIMAEWPLRLYPSQILQSHRGEEMIPLRVVPSFLGYDELELQLDLVTFLEKYYPKESQIRPVEILDDTWKLDKPHGGGSVKALYGRLRSEPMLVVRSALKENELTCRVAYWGIAAHDSFDKVTIDRQSCQEILLDSVKSRVRMWPEERRKYIDAGLANSEAEADRDYGGNLVWNRDMLEQEEKVKAAGLVPKNQKAYKTDDEDLKALRKTIAVCHKLLTVWFADAHYLVHYNVPPLFPSLLPELTEGVAHLSMIQEAVSNAIEGYRGIFDVLQEDRAFLVPDLALELAQGLASCHPQGAKLMLDYSLNCWLKLRGVTEIPSMASVITSGDGSYLEGMRVVLARLGRDSDVRQVDVLLARVKQQLRLEAEQQQDEKQLEAEQGRVFTFEVITVNAQGQEISRKPGQARQIQEVLGNGVALDMVYVPGGTFLMGSPDGEGDADERPQHQVTVAAFHMGKYPVTQAQWQAVAALPQVNRSLNANPSHFKGNNRPVECVSWYDAVEFCDRLSAKTGKTYRLPSEAEWEYACRAGTTTPFYFGATLTTDLANYDGNYTFASEEKGEYRQQTTNVGSFPPNAFGLYDLHGNVWEWCADNWRENYNGAPSDGSIWLNSDETYRLLRGGSWNNDPGGCRCANRNRDNPVNWNSSCGFRVISPASRTL